MFDESNPRDGLDGAQDELKRKASKCCAVLLFVNIMCSLKVYR